MPADPVPVRPSVALPTDVRNYAVWLQRQVKALDTAVQNYLSNPQQPLSQKEAVDFVVTVGHGISWNQWQMGFNLFLAKNFDLLIPGIPIPMTLPAFDWDSVQQYQVEMEGYRSQFKSLGVPVPEETQLPGQGKPPFEDLGNLGIGLGVAATALLVGYLAWKFA